MCQRLPGLSGREQGVLLGCPAPAAVTWVFCVTPWEGCPRDFATEGQGREERAEPCWPAMVWSSERSVHRWLTRGSGEKAEVWGARLVEQCLDLGLP